MSGLCGLRKTFRKRLELLLAVVNEVVEGASLLACKVGQSNDALLVYQRRHAQRERFQYGATDAQLEAVTDQLLLAMHDLRSMLVRRKADRLGKAE